MQYKCRNSETCEWTCALSEIPAKQGGGGWDVAGRLRRSASRCNRLRIPCLLLCILLLSDKNKFLISLGFGYEEMQITKFSCYRPVPVLQHALNSAQKVKVLGTSVSPFCALHVPILSCSVPFRSVLFNNDFCIVACYKIIDSHIVRAFVACGIFNLLCYLAGTHSANHGTVHSFYTSKVSGALIVIACIRNQFIKFCTSLRKCGFEH
jgi:hypothetical protein